MLGHGHLTCELVGQVEGQRARQHPGPLLRPCPGGLRQRPERKPKELFGAQGTRFKWGNRQAGRQVCPDECRYTPYRRARRCALEDRVQLQGEAQGRH